MTMSGISAFTNTSSDAYNWAQNGISVDTSNGLKLSSGQDSLEIPPEQLALVKSVISRLKGNGADFPGFETHQLSRLTPKQMALLATVAQSVAGSLAPDTATAMMALSSERSQLLNDVVKDSVADMQERNQEISRLNNLLQEIRSKGPDKDEDDADWKPGLSGEAFRLMVENGWDKHVFPSTADGDVWESYYPHGKVIRTIPSDVGVQLVKYSMNPEADQEAWVDNDNSKYEFRPSIADSDRIVEGLRNAGIEVNPHSFYSVKMTYPIVNGKIDFQGAPNYELTELKVDLEQKGTNKFAELIQNVKTEIDDLSSSSQLDMVKLQGIINKKNQSAELMTTFQQKQSSLMDRLIGGVNR